MSTAVRHHRRPMLPMFNLLVAGAAVTLGVVAIATDDVSSITPRPAVARLEPLRPPGRLRRRGRTRAASLIVWEIVASPVPGVVVRC